MTTPVKAILVTGGRGFIGRRLVQQLLKSQGDIVVSCDVRPVAQSTAEPRQIEIEIDVRNRQKLHDIFSKFNVSAVFDLASITEVNLPSSEYISNLEMTQSIADCVQKFGVEKYIFYSTQLVFRKESVPPTGEQDYYPIDAYGESKIKSEQWVRSNLPEGRWLILRPTYIWGEENKRFRDGFLYRLAKRQLMLPMEHNILRYYGYVGTICEQTVKLATHRFSELPSRTFYLSDKPISMREFCEYFIVALGRGRTWSVPASLLRLLGRIGEIAGAAGIRFPINLLQANEMTRSYPVPIEPTLAITKVSTEYPRAAAAVVAWALSDPEFARRIGR